MTPPQILAEIQNPPVEQLWAAELEFLRAYDDGPRPPGWLRTPRAVVTFILGSDGLLRLPAGGSIPEGLPASMAIERKFVGARQLVERCVVTLAGERGLLLTGDPGCAKSMLSELLAAGITGSSGLTIQGTAGTTEDAFRYHWNYSMLLASGPTAAALCPSPVHQAMTSGRLVRVEEITRCLPEVQDVLISLLSERRISVPELGGADGLVFARPGFNVIATANLRDRGVSEMSAALKRRFNFELVPPIADPAEEKALVLRQAKAALARTQTDVKLDEVLVDALVTAFRDLRNGRTEEGWTVEKPTSVMSVAEAVNVASSLGLLASWFEPGQPDQLLPGLLLGVVEKDEPRDRTRLLAYWDGPVKRRAAAGLAPWKNLFDSRYRLEMRE